jgi:hypothetical protein
MSSSASEYLRRKLQALPRTYGPSTYGDASQRTAVLRYRNTDNPTPTLTESTTPSCCGGVPSGGPYNRRNGDGQQQVWSAEGLIASRVCCISLSETITVPGCCPAYNKVAGVHYDPVTNLPVTAAYKGAKLTCRGCYQATLASIKKVQDPFRCSCALDPATRVNTLLANDMPIATIPLPPATKACCVPPSFPCPENPCCDADGFLIKT